VSAIVLSRNDAQARDTLHINVTAQQFAWTFSYPDAHNATSPVLRLPEGRSIELDMRSLDVIHAFFVPQFRTNEDIVPGLITNVHVTPDRVGTFPLICNELCGLGHSLMRTEAIVMRPGAFDAWLKQQGKAAAPAPAPPSSSSGSASGLSVFNANGCSTCHTLTAAHATGTIGPDLDKLVSYAQQAHQPLAAFVHESIVSPNAYVQSGYTKGLMPQTFGQQLSTAQLSALVMFLVQSAQQASKG
jgi:cytochrome c oxidase subunit 2